jgi:hypothetical protein
MASWPEDDQSVAATKTYGEIMAVNAGRSTGRGREGMERSGRHGTSPEANGGLAEVGEAAEQPELPATAIGGRQ